ncbi:HDOD domain-containing protein [Maridesulfovibrio ferrireducens]|uniref:HDOD domain-containing protein n=1 Tax=Maridesulfovibrio ferrireducens TaxID=246191 RepID=UPI001A339BE7|nr:HDOD domain-containing protein [Maridesulfovibrio ferrireducens]MBI9111935.1 HDOD domain-containing protein [Maridesulfovibrio ferrireducens]
MTINKNNINSETKKAAEEYVEHIFYQSDSDCKIVKMLKEDANERVYHDMVDNPDEFKQKPQLLSIEPWNGTKPSSPLEFLRKKKVVLPSLPQVLIQIKRVINDPQSTIDDLVAVISKDPKLVAAVLRLANSSIYNLSEKIDTPSKAVAVLGLKKAGLLSLGTVSLSMFKKSEVAVLELEKFWKHSIACGIIAQEIARTAKLGDPEHFFVSGLLHDIGVQIIFESEKSLALELIRVAETRQISFYEAETEVLGFNHAVLGGIISKDWDLPQTLIRAATGHHDPEIIKTDPEAAVVHIADYIARALGYELGLSTTIGNLNKDALKNIEITAEQIKELIPEFKILIGETFKILTPE